MAHAHSPGSGNGSGNHDPLTRAPAKDTASAPPAPGGGQAPAPNGAEAAPGGGADTARGEAEAPPPAGGQAPPPAPEEPAEPVAPHDKVAPVTEHLEELRRRIIWSLLAVAVCVAVGWVYADDLYRFFASRAPYRLTAFGPMEVFWVEFRLGAYAGVAAASPFVLYQALAFVLPALTPAEKRYLYTLLPFAVLLFAAGIAFGYLVLLPTSLRFFQFVTESVATEQIVTPSQYFDLMLKMTLPLGLVFELPIVVWLLAALGVVTARFLRRMWRFAVLVIFVLAAFISPGADVVSQLVMAVPLLLLYELSVWVAAVAERQRGRRQQRAG